MASITQFNEMVVKIFGIANQIVRSLHWIND